MEGATETKFGTRVA